jgi:hypothetical protein
MRIADRIYIHCSYSSYGCCDLINDWHKRRNFPVYTCPITEQEMYIGYHFIILNQYASLDKVDTRFTSITDGLVVPTRPVSIKGAHVKGENYRSIGICYIGYTPTPSQYSSLLNLCASLMIEHGIDLDSILGHYEYYLNLNQSLQKTCPNFSMVSFRDTLKVRVDLLMK